MACKEEINIFWMSYLLMVNFSNDYEENSLSWVKLTWSKLESLY